MARRRHEGACPRAAAVTCFPPEIAPCLPVPPMSDGKGHETAHRQIRVGTFLPHCRTGGPLGGERGTARRPQGGMRRVRSTAPRRVCDRRTIGRASCRLDRARGNVAPARERRRVSCTRPRGGKTLRTLGYELPLRSGGRPALIRD